MLNLDPGKLLVIGVVAIILLGPDRLPQVARQIGGAWRTFNEFRHRMETQVRETMPDLPDTSEIARLARSPSALLNHLSNMAPEEEPDGSFQPPNLNGEPKSELNGKADTVSDPAASAPATSESTAESDGHVTPVHEPAPAEPAPPAAVPAPPAPAPIASAPINVERPPRAPKSSGVVVPGDPTLN